MGAEGVPSRCPDCFRDAVMRGTLSKSQQMHLGEGYHGIKKEFMLYILIPVEKGSPVLTEGSPVCKSIVS